MYGHLERLHGIKRPSLDVTLVGFNLGRIREAVFIPRGKKLQEELLVQSESTKMSECNIQHLLPVTRSPASTSSTMNSISSGYQNILTSTPKQPNIKLCKRKLLDCSSEDENERNLFRKTDPLTNCNDDSEVEAKSTGRQNNSSVSSSAIYCSSKDDKLQRRRRNNPINYSSSSSGSDFLSKDEQMEKSKHDNVNYLSSSSGSDFSEISNKDEQMEKSIQEKVNSLSASSGSEISNKDEQMERSIQDKLNSPSSSSDSHICSMEQEENITKTTTPNKSSSPSDILDQSNRFNTSVPLSSNEEYEENESFLSFHLPHAAMEMSFTDADSDTEISDSIQFTQLRLENKRLRYESRTENISKYQDLPKNKKFISDFKLYMNKDTIATQNKETSTIAKDLRHLFHKEDSFLYYYKSKDKSFSLEDLRSFESENFVNLSYPIDWLVDTVGTDGNKGLDRLKSHQDLRSFIEYSVDQYSSTQDFASKKQAVRDNLASIEKQMSKNRLWNKYTKLSNCDKQDRDKAKKILDPSLTLKIKTCVKTWNDSLEKEEEDRDFNHIYEEAICQKYISKRNFTSWAHYARINLCLSDKSRQSSYKFKLCDYYDRIPQWYPAGYHGFGDLPADWNPNEAPSDNNDAEPSVWIINITGMFIM